MVPAANKKQVLLEAHLKGDNVKFAGRGREGGLCLQKKTFTLHKRGNRVNEERHQRGTV